VTSFKLGDELHRELKIFAASVGMTMTEVVVLGIKLARQQIEAGRVSA